MKSFFRTPVRRQKYTLIAADFAGIVVSLFLCFLLQMVFQETLYLFFHPIVQLPLYPRVLAIFNLSFLFMGISLLVGLIYITTFYISGLYDAELIFNRKKTFIRLSVAVFCGVLTAYVLFTLFSRNIFSREIWGVHLLLTFFILLFVKYFIFLRAASSKPYKILIIGNDSLSAKAIEKLSASADGRFFSFHHFDEEAFFNKGRDDNPSTRYDMIVYSHSKKLTEERFVTLIEKKFDGTIVCSSLTFYKNVTGSFPVLEIDANTLLNMSNSLSLSNRFQMRIKRIGDIYFALVGIIISLPVMIVIAILIKLTSKGPVLFTNERFGIHKKPFPLYKFRTMMQNAEEKTGPVWAQKNDPRVTPIGRFLRKTRLDELPQFFNVLRGEMSFIGPRPIRKFFADKLAKEFPYYYFRFYVKPGLTGWAQVSGDYGETVEGQLRKLEYELFYIHEYSLLLDAVIILKTVQRVLWAKGQ